MFKAIKITGISMVVVSFLLLIAFFATFGQGSATIDSAAGDAIHVPYMTDIVIYWLYALFGIGIVVSIVAALSQFVKSLISNPASAIKSLIPILLFAGIFVVSYIMGSSEKMNIIGYEGTQNEGTWAQIADMFIYTVYALMVLIILTIAGSRVYTALK